VRALAVVPFLCGGGVAIAAPLTAGGAVMRTNTGGTTTATNTTTTDTPPPGGPVTPPPRHWATALVACVTAPARAQRSASFAGTMGLIPGAAAMEMRIDVLERTSPGGGFHVPTAGNGDWRHSAPGVQVLQYVRNVTNLDAPATYRASVRYRWLDARGRVIRRMTHPTPDCVQPDERPKLLVERIDVIASSPTEATYTITLANEGRGTAASFDLVLLIGGVAQPALNVAGLAAATHQALPTVGPRCATGSDITVKLDPAGAIPEAPGGGRAYTVACPL
jgi:hypothetical protein